MLSYSTRKKLADFLLEVNEGERQIEVIRQVLCEQDDFEPYAAFKRIDRRKTGFITSFDIQNFLADNKVNHSERHCQIFVRRYDNDDDGQLNYPEFLQGVLTLDNATLRTITTQRANYDVDTSQYLSIDVEYALAKIIDKEIQFYLNLDDQKNELLSFHDFNYPNAYAVIDKYEAGNINYDNLKTFFKNQSIFPGDDELIAVLRRLDKNDDGLVTFGEFVEALEPISEALKATANRRNASVKFESPSRTSKNLTHSPLRMEASNALKKTASPSRTFSPSKKEALLNTHVTQFDARLDSPEGRHSLRSRPSTSFRKEASPTRKEASPTRREASPPRKEASPYRKEASPTRREASPPRKEASPYRKETSSYRKEASPERRSFAERSFANSRRDTSPIKQTESLTTPLRNTQLERSSLNASGIREGTTSLRKSQIYQDFPRAQTSRSPNRSPVKNTDHNTSKTLNESVALRTSNLAQTPEKRASIQNKQLSTGKSANRSVKKGLTFDDDINHYVLIQTLKQFIVLDKDLEISKQDTALKSDFNLLDFFRTFDTVNNTTISCRDFEAGLIRYNVYPNKNDLTLLFKKMDLDNDGLLRFSDFAETFTPKQKEYANLLHNRTPAHQDSVVDIQKIFCQDTRTKIVATLKLLLENEASSESLRCRLKSKSEMSGHEAFKYLDVKKDGALTSDELIEVFQKNDTFLTEREVRLLMDRLDQDKDGKVSYYELLNAISPKLQEV